MSKKTSNESLYMISVAAKLAGMHPQTLRIYERKQLLRPNRTAKSTRLYSDEDIERLRHIHYLTQSCGVNLAGVKIIIDMEEEMDKINQAMIKMEQQMEERITQIRKQAQIEIRRFRREHKAELATFPRGKIARIIED
jgi:MerR family transcriptional regulator/heat shock protein HspR